MIEDLSNNLEVELAMVQQLNAFITELEGGSSQEQRIIGAVITSLQNRIKMLNSSVREIAKGLTIATPLPGPDTKTSVERLEVPRAGIAITIKQKDRDKYLQELSISDSFIKRLKKKSKEFVEIEQEFKSASTFGRIANKLFLNKSTELVKKGTFKEMALDLRKSNMRILATTYISMMILSTILAFFGGILIAVFFFMFSLGLDAPFIYAAKSMGLTRILQVIWIPFASSGILFCLFYFYPYTEQKSIASRIDGELPFVVIHMSSISGSGVEPSQIFRIVGRSKDYKYTKIEMRKLLNQINIYGYDLVTGLRNVANITPSARFAEVLNGLSTTISSGGDLKTFFEKRAETLLLSYRLERERFAKVAETFMDIYISVVIATPMILLLLLVMISVSGFQVGFTLGQMTLGIIVIVALVNVVFLWILSMRQPAY